MVEDYSLTVSERERESTHLFSGS